MLIDVFSYKVDDPNASRNICNFLLVRKTAPFNTIFLDFPYLHGFFTLSQKKTKAV